MFLMSIEELFSGDHCRQFATDVSDVIPYFLFVNVSRVWNRVYSAFNAFNVFIANQKAMHSTRD